MFCGYRDESGVCSTGGQAGGMGRSRLQDFIIALYACSKGEEVTELRPGQFGVASPLVCLPLECLLAIYSCQPDFFL